MKTPRIVTLVLLVTALTCSMLLSLPQKAKAFACCGWEFTWTYYSNAAHTTVVGKRVKNDCEGTVTMSGNMTQYVLNTSSCCNPC